MNGDRVGNIVAEHPLRGLAEIIEFNLELTARVRVQPDPCDRFLEPAGEFDPFCHSFNFSYQEATLPGLHLSFFLLRSACGRDPCSSPSNLTSVGAARSGAHSVRHPCPSRDRRSSRSRGLPPPLPHNRWMVSSWLSCIESTRFPSWFCDSSQATCESHRGW